MPRTIEDIATIISLGVPKWVKAARKEAIRLNVHINGKNTDEYLNQIDKLENKDQFNLRKKFLTTNRHLFVNLSRPVDKVFSAKGGSNLYNVEGEKLTTLKKELANIRHGKSIRKWIKDIQQNKYFTDPAGLVFFEWKDGKTYPTIKGISSIQNYASEGRSLDWVLFNPKQTEDDKGLIYRFVDAYFDYTILKIDDKYSIVKTQTFENPFGQVPAIVNSDIITSDLTHAESPFEVVISLGDHYLRTGSIKNLNEFLNGYPIFWRYLSDCRTCKGTGYVEGKVCSVCHGTGKNLKKDITDIIQIELPEKDTDVKVAPDLAGYITPPIEPWQEMRSEMVWLTELMELTVWGSRMVKDKNNETATAAFINVQPVNDRLNAFSDAFEDMEKKMTDLMGVFYLKKYAGSSISFGRRFLVESPDAIWLKYQNARASGAPKVSLDYLLMQFFQSEYANDLKRLAIVQKSIKLEPFVHKTDEEIAALPIDNNDKKAKFYFNEWYKTLDTNELLTKEVKQLNNLFNTYLQTKTLTNEIQRT